MLSGMTESMTFFPPVISLMFEESYILNLKSCILVVTALAFAFFYSVRKALNCFTKYF